MRLVLACFLIATAAGISVSAYNRLYEGQKKSFDSNFYSVAQNALNTVSDSFERLNLGILQLAATYGEVFPEQEQWPNVAWDGFHKIVGPLSKIASLQALAVFSMVNRDQASNFTQHLRDYYEARPDEYNLYFNTYMLNHSIWAQNNSLSVPFDVTVGITPPNEFFVPVLQYTISPLADKYYVGYDAHYDVRYVSGIDTVINCTNSFPYETSVSSCAGITDVTPLPWYSVEDPDPEINDMTAAYIHPIFPTNNHSRLVGFAAGTLSWRTMLTKVTPTFVHPIDCVVQAHHSWFTFTIIRGVPKFKGFGDLHEQKFSHYAVVSEALSPSLNHADVNSHRLTLYPTQEFYDEYYNFAPLRAALVMIAIFALCSVLFYAYDILMKREFSRRQAVLDTKRRFVRFISHEIRTPLNTVRLGLKLFEEELRALQHKVEKSPETALTITVKQSLVAWRGLTEEILESSDSAVEVLDDLLNYDKIEIGTLRLEFGLFDVRELVTKCTSLMQVHAKQKGIVLDLQYTASNPGKIASPRSVAWAESSHVVSMVPGGGAEGNITSLEEARGTECAVVGDATRLSQVLRNLISNALKFTPSKGVVTISGEMPLSFLSYSITLLTYFFYFLSSHHNVRRADLREGAAVLSTVPGHVPCGDGLRRNQGFWRGAHGASVGADRHGRCAVQRERAPGGAGQRPGAVYQQGHRGAARRTPYGGLGGAGQGSDLHRGAAAVRGPSPAPRLAHQRQQVLRRQRLSDLGRVR